MEDLVTLRASLERTSGTNYGDWLSSENWIADALTRLIVAEPGTRMLYPQVPHTSLGPLIVFSQ
ncbi:hypothetical protein NBRC116589_40240 [Ruegeria sp. HU-ET01832]